VAPNSANTPLFWVIYKLVLAMINLHTKFAVLPSVTLSKMIRATEFSKDQMSLTNANDGLHRSKQQNLTRNSSGDETANVIIIIIIRFVKRQNVKRLP